jgi:ABC-type bacteriocin/lantibiotic exporter with double-glycine peptidase domain
LSRVKKTPTEQTPPSKGSEPVVETIRRDKNQSIMKEKNLPAPAAYRAVYTVPFYSQFANISTPSWQKVGCGIASVAMIIDYYADETIVVDTLLEQGIKDGSYLSDAGWTHAGLIALAQAYGLDGKSVSLSGLGIDEAFKKFKQELAKGPLMASVHYTFEPTNPIPHLVVITGVADGLVYYNDPAEVSGGGSLSIEKFQQAWKKRYISIRPV